MNERNGITVIIPSIGRETLRNTLASLGPQLQPEDAIIVVSEGDNHTTQQLVYDMASYWPSSDWAYIVHDGYYWGHPNRNHAMNKHVETTHVWTLDDDDEATPEAMTALRNHMNDPWTIFKMTFGPGHRAHGVTCWREQKIQAGDIGTPMIFAPLGKARFGYEYMGDLIYAQQLREERGEPVWAEDVIATIRP